MLSWRTRYCCFGCTVKEATLVIALLFIVIRSINLVLACMAYVQLPILQIDVEFDVKWLPAFLLANMVDCLFEITGCVLLIKATKDDNRYLLIPWLIYNGICLLYNIVGAIHFLLVAVYVGLAGVVGGILVIFLSLRIYFFLIVAVYYKLILEGMLYVFQFDDDMSLKCGVAPGVREPNPRVNNDTAFTTVIAVPI